MGVGHLDTGAVPASATESTISHSSATVDVVDPEKGRGQEENRSQEAECNISLELRAGAFACNSTPVPDAAAVHGANKICKKAEGNHKPSEKKEVHRVMDEAAGERKQEDQRE